MKRVTTIKTKSFSRQTKILRSSDRTDWSRSIARSKKNTECTVGFKRRMEGGAIMQ